MPYLLVKQPGAVPFTLELGPELRMGREPDNDLVLDDRHVSRRHARIVAAADGYRIVDEGSRHGTQVNGRPASGEPLRDGDLIQVGAVGLTFRDGAPEESRVVVATAGLLSRPDDADARRMQLLLEVGRAVDAAADGEELAARLLAATVDVLGCARGVIGLQGGGGTGRRIVRGAAPGEIVLGRAVLARLERRESVLLEGAHAAMAAPLESGDRVLGYLYVEERAAHRFDGRDLDFLTALGRLAGAALAQAESRRGAAAVAEALLAAHPVPVILGRSAPMLALLERVRRFGAAAHTAVLIRGESGTGKELVARTLHACSPRASRPYVTVNCAAIPESLIESELFGHEKGAFTGAVKPRRGKLVLASGGTLFLDEVGDLSLAAQAKLLRALQEGEVQPLGSETILRVDVRFVSATHKPLRDEIAAGRFREDLYYRLALAELEVPPLRARGDDVVLLAEAFLRAAAARAGRLVEGFAPGAEALLRGYGWPGNVRQLQNEVERAVILSDGPLVDLVDLRARVAGGGAAATPHAAELTLAERFTQLEVTERALVAEALQRAGGNAAEAARLLGITRIMMVKRMARFGITARPATR